MSFFRPLKWMRQGISVLGFGAGVGFVSYGAYALKDSTTPMGITTVAVGALLTVQSCCMCSMNYYGDKQVERILSRVEEQNEALRTSLVNMNALAQSQENQISRQEVIVKEAEKNIDSLKEHKQELVQSIATLKESNVEYQKRLNENLLLSQKMEAQIEALEATNEESAAQIEDLHSVVVEQKEQILKLAEQARNLNELQRKSVEMIQKLALYGNECKKFGVDLKDVSTDLKATDESLGLTRDEMRSQVRALGDIMKALERTDRSLRQHGAAATKKKRTKKKSGDELV